MTINTNRNNIKPMFRFITFVVMIMLSGLRTENAEQKSWRNQFACINCMIYSFSRFVFFRMFFACKLLIEFAFFTLIIFICPSFFCKFTFFRLRIPFMRQFSRFCFAIFSLFNRLTGFAIILITCCSVFVKFRNRFEVLAFRTTFCLNCLRHDLFLLKKGYCLEPVTGYAPVVGSLYFHIM